MALYSQEEKIYLNQLAGLAYAVGTDTSIVAGASGSPMLTVGTRLDTTTDILLGRMVSIGDGGDGSRIVLHDNTTGADRWEIDNNHSTGDFRIFQPGTVLFYIEPNSGNRRTFVKGPDNALGVAHREDGYNETIYSAADISLGTGDDADFVDADATNAKITFTVNVPGRFRVEFNFSGHVTGTGAGASIHSATYFRLTDGTNNTKTLAMQLAVDDAGGQTPALTVPFTLVGVFNFTTTGSKTVKLQKRNITSTAIGDRLILSSNSVERALVMRAYRISN